ncbi:MAG: hypothetical protein FJ125_00065, partial [Deltaproteobacteria bacterium]|nr:hypothetical protein [Deltaproteobacteria bacterium]
MTKQVEGNRFFEIAWETSHAPNLWMNVEGAPLEASMYMLCDVLGQGDLCIYDAAVSAKWRVRSRKVPPVALQGNSGALVLRRELAEPIFADVPSTEVRLRPAPLRDAKGLVDDGFVAVETFGYVPLDRDAAEATYSDPDNRHGAHVREVGRAAWGPGREPRLRIFRLLERPHLLFIDAELLAALRTATSKAIRAADPARRPGLLPFPPPYAFAALPPLVAERDKAARAGQAFWELYRGESSPELRRVAVSHPHYAYAVATSIDRGPADDTRAGACRHPSTAALYAVRVDRAAHPDTRRAAEAEA